MAERPILVKATHAYAPVNNDELRLEKGEILTVTRKEDGGWWEGTLSNGKTGWFPSNYVENIVLIMSSSSSTSPLSSLSAVGPMDNNPQHHQQQDVATTTLPSSPQGSIGAGLNVSISNGTNGEPSTAFAAQQAEYRQIAFKELIESEMGHVQELQTFWEVYLAPLQKSEILKPGEFKTIVGNILEVTNMHLNLILNPLRSEQNKAAKDQRIGNIFLENATKFEEIHKAWGSNHPRAVQTVEKYKEQLSIFIESKGGRKPGILYIITLLSQPFRRLEKYPMLLQEIERHVEEFHKDRGDLQRSIEYYKDVQKTCSALRKQKEMELEVLSGSGIKDWEGSDVSQLGDIIFMNLVHLGNERHPRYLVLFPNTLLILSYSTETNSLVYEGKVPVSGITLRPLADKDALVNAFEIAGPMIDQITVGCASKAIRETWLAHLNSILKTNRFPSFSSSPQQSFGHLTPPVSQAWTIDRLRPSPPFNPFLAEYLNSVKKQNNSASTTSLNANSPKITSLNNVRSQSAGGGVPSIMSFSSNYNNAAPTVTNEEEFAILALVDSFCTTNRHTEDAGAVERRVGAYHGRRYSSWCCVISPNTEI
ncbi:rho guanine nucleotide exchange factor 7 isoform X2 [Folsomia candida]|uniref:rho guanine nucleotide exchange factor 7 isoform X2 n=1 Tax=Folsomia candida TaxID=158441 RepID=UPI000B8F0301|nr:rho guanine nucleotide exchange factor 7 isoform X2 [Folsomia candida]XP_021948580.1 rho guanine nucleotide exchange factor 7 isoform X2 [Folsomia candida]